MYSNFKSVQILVSLLKEYEIRDIVLSPGGSDIPVIHSIETDPFFKCYSVVDERSAAYFALGVAQQKNRPVACVCTSGTAVCNYVPGITEAFYQSAPVLAITCDKNPYYQDQLETQKIKQENMFNGVVKKSVNLPTVANEEDLWLCNRLVNEALLELTNHGNGPCHINIPIVGSYDVYPCSELPKQRVIKYVDLSNAAGIEDTVNKLKNYRKILVVAGQNVVFTPEDVLILNKFFEKFNCCFGVEHVSNLRCDGCVYTYPVTETSFPDELVPDLVISIGNNLAAYGLKPALRKNYLRMSNWLVCESGAVRDAYKSLESIFEMKPMDFFTALVEHAEDAQNDKLYFEAWNKKISEFGIPDLEFGNLYVARELSKVIPENSILHLAVLNSTRVMQFFQLKDGVKVYSNLGALGIDGCMSTFAGQSAAFDGFAYLLIGDLSFFYDMNAAGIRSIGPNVRIILLNNGGGSEFHFFMGKDKIPTINDYICAEHSKVAAGWISSLDFDYYPVSNVEELSAALKNFDKLTEKPQFIEVFGDMELDAQRTRELYESNSSSGGASGIKKALKKVIPDKQLDKAKRILRIVKEK